MYFNYYKMRKRLPKEIKVKGSHGWPMRFLSLCTRGQNEKNNSEVQTKGQANSQKAQVKKKKVMVFEML